MYNIIALCGEAGAGKDRVLREIIDNNTQYHEIISCTTRPKREGEKEGVNYYYLTNEQFAKQVLSNQMLEATEFRDWFYGTSIDALEENKVNIGVFNPAGIEILMADPRVNIKVYKIIASPKTRLLRQLQREQEPDVEEIIRRYKTDQLDFLDCDFEYIALRNETTEDLTDIISYFSSQAPLDNFD